MKSISSKPVIGIVGGMGPAAGIDLANKIIQNTRVKSDHDHLAQILYTDAAQIGDRTEYILKNTHVNPAYAIYEILMKLDSMGVTVAGVPCNSAHAPQIFAIVEQEISRKGTCLKLLNMIDEVGLLIRNEYPAFTKIGILGTYGTFAARQYDRIKKLSLQTVYLSEEKQQQVHRAIYDQKFGIKAQANPISPKVLKIVNTAISQLIGMGAEAVVLACTELAMIPKKDFQLKIPVINSSQALARGLIKTVAPEKLLPYQP